MNAEEENRLVVVVQKAVVEAINTLLGQSKGETLGDVEEKDTTKTAELYEKEVELMGENGLSEWDVPTEVVEAAAAGTLAANVAAETPAAPPPPLPPPSIAEQQQQLNSAIQMADNIHNFPPKVCPRCGSGMQYSDLAGGYMCGQHGLNPKPSLLQRLTGGVQELSTAAIATTGAVAGAGMGVMGASMAAQGQMATMQGQMAAGPPPALPAPGGGFSCPTCSQPAQDMSPYGGEYAGKYYCNTCRDWVVTSSSGIAPVVA
jgi:hypothetical protein|tara:strand:+ start:7459 stop:8238 length:780 start_codon:yes stop_codon:yes gene_type:complete